MIAIETGYSESTSLLCHGILMDYFSFNSVQCENSQDIVTLCILNGGEQ